jgi:hypothetical protein
MLFDNQAYTSREKGILMDEKLTASMRITGTTTSSE